MEHGLGYLPFTEKQVITPTGLCLSMEVKISLIILSFEFGSEVFQLFMFQHNMKLYFTLISGSIYIGVDFCKKLCGVSVIRR